MLNVEASKAAITYLINHGNKWFLSAQVKIAEVVHHLGPERTSLSKPGICDDGSAIPRQHMSPRTLDSLAKGIVGTISWANTSIRNDGMNDAATSSCFLLPRISHDRPLSDHQDLKLWSPTFNANYRQKHDMNKSPPHPTSAGGYAGVWDASRGLGWHRLLVGRNDIMLDHRRWEPGCCISWMVWPTQVLNVMKTIERRCGYRHHFTSLLSLSPFSFRPPIPLHFTVYTKICGCSEHTLLFTLPAPDS